MRNIGFIRKYLTRSATEKLVHSLISSRLDFGNGLLYNLPNSQIAQLQKLQNAAARIVSLSSKRSHITPILETLHWLPVKGGRPLERGHDQDRFRKQIMSFRHSVRGQV